MKQKKIICATPGEEKILGQACFFELRIKRGSDILRVLYFFFIGNKAVLTNGFIKKTQKTPVREITLAQKYDVWRCYDDTENKIC